MRVAGLKDQVAAGHHARRARRPHAGPAAARDPRPGRRSCVHGAGADLPRRGRARPRPTHGIVFSSWAELDEDDVKHLDEVFEERIFPVLTPLAVDPEPPVPLHLAPVAEPRRAGRATPETGERRFARVKVPTNLPRFVVMPDGERFVPARAGHRRPPRPALPGHGDRGPLRLPGHPQRRPHPRGGGGRRPPRGRRDGAAAPAVPAGRCASRSTDDVDDEILELHPARARPRRRRRLPRRSARSTSAGCGRCTPSTAPTCKDPPWSPLTPPRFAARRGRATPTSSPRIRARRRARPPPLRQLHGHGRGVHPPGGAATPRCSPSR